VSLGEADRLPQTASEASIYLSAKLSFTPVSPRSVCNVFAYLLSTSSPLPFINAGPSSTTPDPSSYHVSEGSYERERERIFLCESLLLSSIGFDTHVALPHTLALTYLQALGVSSKKLASRVLEHLNGGLLSPQLLYLTHQPNALAVAAIYVAAKEVRVKLVDGNWWEVFDVEREDLGFLVLAFGSLEGFAKLEMERWSAEGGTLCEVFAAG
jgi:cyclin L